MALNIHFAGCMSLEAKNLTPWGEGEGPVRGSSYFQQLSVVISKGLVVDKGTLEPFFVHRVQQRMQWGWESLDLNGIRLMKFQCP